MYIWTITHSYTQSTHSTVHVQYFPMSQQKALVILQVLSGIDVFKTNWSKYQMELHWFCTKKASTEGWETMLLCRYVYCKPTVHRREMGVELLLLSTPQAVVSLSWPGTRHWSNCSSVALWGILCIPTFPRKFFFFPSLILQPTSDKTCLKQCCFHCRSETMWVCVSVSGAED